RGPEPDAGALERVDTAVGFSPGLARWPSTRPCRVALGSCLPRAPTDPDVRNCRIRLVRSTLHTRRYTEWTTRAAGSGSRSSRPHRLAQPKRPFQLRRESHFRQMRATTPRIRLSEAQFPVTP